MLPKNKPYIEGVYLSVELASNMHRLPWPYGSRQNQFHRWFYKDRTHTLKERPST